MIATIELSADQAHVMDRILSWRSNPARSPFLTLGGLAGSGKSTLVSLLMEEWPNVATVALCGKAAHVLRSKGCDAQTVHSLIYIPFENELGQIRFKKRKYLEGIDTIIVDEASMIDHILMQDLLSFHRPVLFVGDHGQLEPIGTNPGLMVNPDLRLEKIHRQALDNPILRLAAALREGRPVPYWDDPEGRVSVRRAGDFASLISPQWQMICGLNKTRHAVNVRVREMLGKRGLVTPGEKLIVLKNNKLWNIFNGQQVTVVDITHQTKRRVSMVVETDDNRRFAMTALPEQFGADLLKDFKRQDIALVDYGYCLTAHKSQGSEWDQVLVLEERGRNWDVRRWGYTAATRAKERLIYCK